MSDSEDVEVQQPDLQSILVSIQQRLDSLELKFQEKTEDKGSHVNTKHGSADSDSVVHTTKHENNNNSTDTGAAATSTIQKDFAAIKDTVGKVQLDSSLRLCEGPCPTGVNNKTERAVYFILQKSSRYVETALKVMQLAFNDLDHHDTVNPTFLE